MGRQVGQLAVNRSGRVFISHSTVDADVAMEFCRLIEARGVRCAIAPRDIPPGHNWPSWITESITAAAGFVLVLSRHSNASVQVQREIALAFDGEGLPIFPVRIDSLAETELHPGLRFYLGSQQIVDAVGPVRQRALQNLSKTIARRMLGERGAADPDQPMPGMPGFAPLLLAGPFWCFRAGRDGLGLTICGLMALLVLVTGWFDSLGGAVLVLLAAWLCVGVLLRANAANLGLNRGGNRANLAGGLSGAALLILALAIPALGNEPVAPRVETAALAGNPAAATGATDSAGQPINHAAPAARNADIVKREQDEQTVVAWLQGYFTHVQQQQAEQAAAVATADAAAAADGAASAAADAASDAAKGMSQ